MLAAWCKYRTESFEGEHNGAEALCKTHSSTDRRGSAPMCFTPQPSQARPSVMAAWHAASLIALQVLTECNSWAANNATFPPPTTCLDRTVLVGPSTIMRLALHDNRVTSFMHLTPQGSPQQSTGAGSQRREGDGVATRSRTPLGSPRVASPPSGGPGAGRAAGGADGRRPGPTPGAETSCCVRPRIQGATRWLFLKPLGRPAQASRILPLTPVAKPSAHERDA